MFSLNNLFPEFPTEYLHLLFSCTFYIGASMTVTLWIPSLGCWLAAAQQEPDDHERRWSLWAQHRCGLTMRPMRSSTGEWHEGPQMLPEGAAELVRGWKACAGRSSWGIWACLVRREGSWGLTSGLFTNSWELDRERQMLCQGQDVWEWLCQERFKLDVRDHFFTRRVAICWNRSPGEGADVPSIEETFGQWP